MDLRTRKSWKWQGCRSTTYSNSTINFMPKLSKLVAIFMNFTFCVISTSRHNLSILIDKYFTHISRTNQRFPTATTPLASWRSWTFLKLKGKERKERREGKKQKKKHNSSMPGPQGPHKILVIGEPGIGRLCMLLCYSRAPSLSYFLA